MSQQPSYAAVSEDAPYPGLRPYHESEQDKFFGRDADCKILIDKILVHRLTLLFAATGVGKSSLLQAAVLPQLKAPHGENLDVVYYIDWVSNPLTGLRQAVQQALQDSGSWRPEIVYAPREGEKLADFFSFCTLFVRQPLVVVLDQFEEFFRYQRVHDSFEPFLEQLTGVFSDLKLPVHLVFSMREDFALELNAFKKYVPLSVFNNLYRLEKLGRKAAEMAILEPLKPTGFRCEPELLQQLLKDLLSRELSRNSSNPLTDTTEMVEPPYLQITCRQLWEQEQNNLDKTLHLKTYQNAGGAKGFLSTYLQNTLKDFSIEEKDLVSRLFDYLIGYHDVKIAYTAEDLAQVVYIDEFELQKILEKLSKVRILRSQYRDQKIWYEIYHDMFAESIKDWNKKWKQYDLKELPEIHIKNSLQQLSLNEKIIASNIFSYIARDQLASFIFTLGDISMITNTSKEKIKPIIKSLLEKRILKLQKGKNIIFHKVYHESLIEPLKQWNLIERNKLIRRKTLMLLSYILLFIVSTYFGVLFYINATDYHLKFSSQADGNIEIFSGNSFWPDPFSQHKYIYESILTAQDIEPDKRFINRSIMDYSNLNTELISFMSIENRVNSYIETGSIDKAMSLIDKAKFNDKKATSRSIMRKYFLIKTKNGFNLSNQYIMNNLDDSAKDTIKEIYLNNTLSLPLKTLSQFKFFYSKFKSNKDYQSSNPISDPRLIDILITLLDDEDSFVRANAIHVIGENGGYDHILPITKMLRDKDELVRQRAVITLGKIGNQSVTPELMNMLKDESESVRESVVNALGDIGDPKTILNLEYMLKDESESVRLSAATALSKIRDPTAIKHLTDSFHNDANEYVQLTAASALGEIGNIDAIKYLTDALNNKNEYVRLSAAIALSKTGDLSAINYLTNALLNNNEYIRLKAMDTLEKLDGQKNQLSYKLGKKPSFDVISSILSELDFETRKEEKARLILFLGQTGEHSIAPVLYKNLFNDNEEVRSSVILSLGMLKYIDAISKLEQNLADESELVRIKTIQSLSEFSDPRSIPLLESALTDESEKVRLHATQTLAKIGIPSNIKFFRLKENTLHDHASITNGTHLRQNPSTEPTDQSIESNRNKEKLEIIKNEKADKNTITSLIMELGESKDKSIINDLKKLQPHPNFDKDITQAIDQIEQDTLSSEEIINDPSRKIAARWDVLQRLAKEDPTTAKQEILRIIQQPEEDAFSNLAYRLLGDLQITDNGVVPLLQQRLDALDEQFRAWRKLRDSNPLPGLSIEEQDKVLEEIRQAKDAIKNQHFAFDYAYALARLDPDIGKQLLTHNLADVRKGAYMGFAMKTNIQTLKALDEEREARRDDPIFRHEAFRAIDLGLRRLEVLGKQQEIDELKAWQTTIKDRLMPPDDHEDEVYERLEWTTMMMDHYKDLEIQFKKEYDMVREWPEEETVNQPYPSAGATP